MENQYKRLFDSIAPIKSDEELLRAVLDRKAEKMSSKKKFSKKAILIPVAAAALLGTTAIGVSAAYQWNLPAAFEDLFRNRFEEYNGTSGSKMKNVMFDFSSVGTAIGESRKGEGYTLTIDGVVADTHTAHFMYTIEFNDKFPYDYKHTDVDGTGWFDWGVRDFEITINGVQANTGSSMSDVDKIWLNNNTLRGRFTIVCGDMSFENSDITLNIGTLRRSHITDCLLDDEQKIDCGMSFNFKTGDMSGMERSAAPNKTIALEGIGNAVVTEVNITPFGLNYTILPADGQKVSFEEFFNAIFADDGGICITLKNGVNISATTCTSAPMNGGIECSVELSYPVNPADVVNITLCGHEIDLSAAAANVTAQ